MDVRRIHDLAVRFSIIPVGIDKRPHAALLKRAGAFEYAGENGHRKTKAVWKPFQSRRATDGELAIWIAGRPPAWAIITGKVSGAVVLDYDGEDGRRLVNQWGVQPHVRTGSGGFHHYVQHPGFRVKTLNAEQSRNLYGKRWPGLDVKGDGGYAIVVGRNHKGEYEALRALEPDPWESLPVELREFLWKQSPDHVRSSRPSAEQLVRMALERVGGGRNNTGTWLACQLRDNGYSSEDARAAMRQFRGGAPATNSKGETEEYTDNEIDATIKSIFGTPKRESWSRRPTAANASDVDCTHPYRERHGGIIRLKAGRDGSEEVIPLTNFTARISANIAEDDGVEVRRSFEISAALRAQAYKFVVPANRFASMEWPIENLGAGAIVHPNQKDWARAAIQSLSTEVSERRIYTHTGWRKVGDNYVYLHGGGAIGASGAVSGVDVRLSGALAHYDLALPDSPDLLRAAIRASLRVLDVAADRVTFPLLAAVYRACIRACDFAVWFGGPTGVFKSELGALAQQHYGRNMNARHLPGNFASTGNAIEMLAFSAKDALLLVDDFAPQGTTQDVSRYHATADRLLRAAGNNQGRGRLSADARLREAKPPRGLIVATGEDVPRGQSIRGRTLIVEVAPGDVRTDVLTECQAAADDGSFAHALAGFIRWLAADYQPDYHDFLHWVADLRSQATKVHSRTPGIVADLYAGFDLLSAFAVDTGAIKDEQKDELTVRCWQALNQVARAQRVQRICLPPSAPS
jgi:hypothetical protein